MESGSKLPCKTQTFETFTEKYSSNFVSTILLTDGKIFTVVTPKIPKNHQLYASATLAHTVNTQTVTDGISRRVTSCRQSIILILVDLGDKALEGCYRNMMLL